jgi:hypothetical protein
LTGRNGQVVVQFWVEPDRQQYGKAILQKTYRAEIGTHNLTVSAAIIGIGSGVSKIFAEFMNDIR